jgi:hypothetical protein
MLLKKPKGNVRRSGIQRGKAVAIEDNNLLPTNVRKRV